MCSINNLCTIKSIYEQGKQIEGKRQNKNILKLAS